MKDRLRLTWLSAAVLAVIPVSTVIMALRLRNGLFWGDHIGLFAETGLHERFTPAGLFAFHNEHLVVPMKLALYADLHWFGGWQWFTASLAVLLAALPPLVCWRALAREIPELGNSRLAFCGAVLTSLYGNGMLLWDLHWPILLQHFFAVAAVLGLAAWLAWNKRQDWGGTAAILAICGLGAICSANGALTPLVVGAVALFTGRRWLLGASAAGLLLVTAPYYLAYRASRPSFAVATASPWEALHFAVLFVGGAYWRDSSFPFESHSEPAVVYAAAVAFCVLMSWLVLGLWRKRERLTSFEVFHLTLLIFVALSALAGGVFRSQLGPLEGLNKKYAATAFLAWLSVASLVIRLRPGLVFEEPWRPPLVAGILLAWLVPSGAAEFRLWRAWNDRVRECTAAVLSEAAHPEALRSLYFDERRAAEVLGELRRRRKGWIGSAGAQQAAGSASSMK
jgi:hypothetical protein